MKATEGKIGRVFVLRLEDGDVVPDCIEAFAAEKGIRTGFVSMTGGVGSGEIVVGPHDKDQRPLEPIKVKINEAHEVNALGIIACDSQGKPTLHIHGSFGRQGTTITGCMRSGVKTWLVGEALVYEIVGAEVVRSLDPSCGFELLQVAGAPVHAPVAKTEVEPASPAPVAAESKPEPEKSPESATAAQTAKPAERRSRVMLYFNAELC
ncbi:MAG: DUF296 domain-containing protein [Planctomycetes bacterium]|nr:DUF296 domain-containing protein [Planctomycetota bacterium]